MKLKLPVIGKASTEEVGDPGESKREEQRRLYRNGGEGCVKWIEDHCWAPVYEREADSSDEVGEGMAVSKWIPMKDLSKEESVRTGRSYWSMWEMQKEEIRKALEMNNGRLKHNIIVFCWPRGEGKSFIACLIQLWKFFNFGRQQITLGANSKDQIKFVHFDIMKDIILNSPKLLEQVGANNVHEKEIRLKDSKGNIRSSVRAISSFTGIVSNITGFTFSEIFAMKKPTFFVQLSGSIRNMPNALGVIDSTVSDKTHVLYNKLYMNFIKGISKKVYFSYRCSKHGDQEDYMHPFMDNEQLNEYKNTFPFGEFERYFLNLWEAGSVTVFTDSMIEEMGYVGMDGLWFNHGEIQKVIGDRDHIIEVQQYASQKKMEDGVRESQSRIDVLNSKFMTVEKEAYSFKKTGGFDAELMIDGRALESLTEKLDTHWSLGVGLDMADPLAVQSLSRSILTFVVKGLPRSRSDTSWMLSNTKELKYVYFLVGMYHVESNDLNQIKSIMSEYHTELGGIDTVCFERFAAWDMVNWCEDREVEFTPIFPNYEKQREAFKELYNTIKDGRFKAPVVPILGSKESDLLREEMKVFYHDLDGRWFGSPEKGELYGIRDDAMYSIAWSMFGSKLVTPTDFRVRRYGGQEFGLFIPNKQLEGRY